MAAAQVIEGTVDEVARQLRATYGSDERLKVVVESQDARIEDTPDPPFAVRSAAELEDLLTKGLQSPTHPVTDDTWEHIRAEVRRRSDARRASSG